jgi:hypothetical protein
LTCAKVQTYIEGGKWARLKLRQRPISVFTNCAAMLKSGV